MRVKDGLQKLGLVAVALLIALLIGECSVRVLGLAPEVVAVEKGRYRLSANLKIGYEPVPGLQYDGQSLHFYDYRGAANRLGYRDVDHELAAKAGSYRIAVLGDSIAAGHFIPTFEQMFSTVLGDSLRGRGLDVEVLNFGVSGYNTQQEVETFKERGLAYRPDLVLVAYCLNDRERNDGGILATLVQEARGKGVAPASGWLHKSALFRTIWYRVLRRHQRRPAAYDQLSGDSVASSLHELAELGREQHFAVLVAIFPELSDLADYRFEQEHRFVADIATREGLRVLDLLEPFRVCPGPLAHDRYHPNVRGHHCAGRAMAEAIAPLIERAAVDRSH